MTPNETMALAKVVKKATMDKARKELTVGTHEVDFTARVKGTITVGKDEMVTPTANIPLKITLALFVRYSGITGDSALSALERAMTEALNSGDTAETNIAEIALLDKAQAKIEAMLGNLPKVSKPGKVTTKLEIIDC